VLKKRDQIISLVHRRTTRYLKRTHKFGIEIPKTVNSLSAKSVLVGEKLVATYSIST
jgi:hypothetical protein